MAETATYQLEPAEDLPTDDLAVGPRMSTPSMTPKSWANSGSGQTLDVSKAQRIIKAFTDDPSWLADPRTSHAANSVFSAASKVIGLNIQLENASARSEAAKARNSIAGRVGQSLLKLAETGEVGAGIAAKWYALGEDGKPLYENPANASRIFEDYKAHTDKKTFSPGPMERDQKWLEDKRATGTPEQIKQAERMFDRTYPKEGAAASRAMEVSPVYLMRGLEKDLDAAEVQMKTSKPGTRSHSEAKTLVDHYRGKISQLDSEIAGGNTTPSPSSNAPLDRETAQKLLLEAGGDKDKARDLARQRGYKF